jgi:hypothetical protein
VPDLAVVGPWAREKLDALGRYLEFYTKVLKNQPWRTIYVDAFARGGRAVIRREEPTGAEPIVPLFGEAFVPDADQRELIDGSPRVALGVADTFDRYIFIEPDPARADELQAMKDEYGSSRTIDILRTEASEGITWVCTRRIFVHSTDSHRSYWLLHLSNHRQARDEMGKLHWRLNNHFQHHGEAGFHALGYDPSKDIRQGLMTFMFDDDAMARSEAAVLDQLPRMIHEANRDGGVGLSVEQLFAGNCNDTPVTSEILERQLILLREEGELTIVNESGVLKPRARTVAWDDRLILPRQQSMFARLRLR